MLAYVLPSAVFEAEYDWGERAVFVLACRSASGGRPGGYYVFDGRRVRVHLLEALETAGVVDETLRARLRDATRRSGAAAMEIQLAVFSAALAERFDALIDRYEAVFRE